MAKMKQADKEGPTQKRATEKKEESPLESYYDSTLRTLGKAVDAGSVNSQMGVAAMVLMADILHGGAYAAGVNERPYFLANPKSSIYYAGELEHNKQGEGLAGFFAGIWSGQNAGDLWKQIIEDSNVPHVLPKLISDEAYAEFMIIAAQASSSDLFNSVGTGVKTYVAAANELASGPIGEAVGGAARKVGGVVSRRLQNAGTAAALNVDQAVTEP